MTFWGVEVEPNKPYIHRPDDEGGRLHVSQATLSYVSCNERCVVQCKVGNRKPICMCSLLPENIDSCQLDLEFEEEDEVTFSVVGAARVHLTGFFYGKYPFGKPNSNVAKESPVADIENDLKTSFKCMKETKGKKKIDQKENTPNPNAVEKSLPVWSFHNGLVIEVMECGKPGGILATTGKIVSMHYIGKLKDGEIFHSSYGGAPFTFRLGMGEVIKGLEFGVHGMRAGGKRRLTIPPAMGYGTERVGPRIPPNSWLIFDVELIDVK